MKLKAFTLVELIVVITILAILGAISFVTLQNFSKEARDSKRITDTRNLLGKITVENTKGTPIERLIEFRKNNNVRINGDVTEVPEGVANFANLMENGTDFKDPLYTNVDYPVAYSYSGQVSNGPTRKFLQIATISESENVTKIFGNYYKQDPIDSPSLFVNEGIEYQNDGNDLIYGGEDDIDCEFPGPAGVLHSPSLGIITIKDGNCGGIIIADKNVGASEYDKNGNNSNAEGDYYYGDEIEDNLCSSGFHVPSRDEWQLLLDIGNGKLGWSDNISKFVSDLLLPNEWIDEGYWGYYWTSTRNKNKTDMLIFEDFSIYGIQSIEDNDEWDGQVRCFKNTKPINGTCGESNGGEFSLRPSSNLCSTGTATAVLRNNDLREWSCKGIFGGDTSTCTATKGSSNIDLALCPENPTPSKYFLFDEDTRTILAYSENGPRDVVIPCEINDVPVENIYGSVMIDSRGEIWNGEEVSFLKDKYYAQKIDKKNKFNIKLLSNTIIPQTFSMDYTQEEWEEEWGWRDGESVPEWGAFTFMDINSVVMAGTIKNVGDGAFYGTPITQATISSGIQNLGNFSFTTKYDYGCPPPYTSELEHVVNYDGNVSEEYVYGPVEGGIEIVRYFGPDNIDLIIPSQINGKNVVSLGGLAFAGVELNSVQIPSTVTKIKDATFIGSALEGINLPNSIIEIGKAAFSYNYLDELIIPSSLRILGKNAFSNSNLTKVEIKNGITTIGEYAFSDNQISSLIIPSSVKTIQYGAFSYNNLTTLSIPNTVTTIEEEAFSSNSINNLTIGTGITTIPSYAFSYNDLANVNIPNNIVTIDSGAFYRNKINNLTLGTGVTSIGSSAFSYNSLTNVTIPANVTSISNNAFYSNNFNSVTIEYNASNLITRFNSNWTKIGFPAHLKISALPITFQGFSTTQANNFDYFGSYYIVEIPTTGKYRLEVWGAQGGYRSNSTYGGKGGYAAGEVNLTAGTKLYVYAGGSGNSGGVDGGWNGGGVKSTYPGGGGASDIRLSAGDLYSRILVAGGGGSDGAIDKAGGYGGGTVGESRTDNYSGDTNNSGKGGTQTAGGGASATLNTSIKGSFGQGGAGVLRSKGYGGAGGGGWYGGSGTYPDTSTDDDRGGGGGAGFVWTSSSVSNVPSGYNVPASLYLSNTKLIPGNQSMPAHNSTSGSMTGKTGDGYARITYIGE